MLKKADGGEKGSPGRVTLVDQRGKGMDTPLKQAFPGKARPRGKGAKVGRIFILFLVS